MVLTLSISTPEDPDEERVNSVRRKIASYLVKSEKLFLLLPKRVSHKVMLLYKCILM